MDENRVLFLLNKQAQGICTAEELAELDGWYKSLGGSTTHFEGMDDKALAAEMLQQFRKRATATPIVIKQMPVAKVRYWLAAASVLLLLLAGSFFFFNRKTMSPPEAVFVKPGAPATFIRQLTLPDGSRVVLKPNSILQYPPQFGGNTRTVTLSGEAYFDVAHNPVIPFIIYTGKVTTTVLGTAFNIAAWPEQTTVAVTVTRGKVRVSNGAQTLALLTANQQLLYNHQTASVQQTQTATPPTGWLKHGLTFTDQPMRTIVLALEKRFQTTIVFANAALQNCTVTASFDGTETLEQVLDVLCLTISAKYQPQNEGYLLTGEGCQ